MKIRDKLFFAFSLYVGLAVLGGFLAYTELSTVTKKLKLVETASDITNYFLEARRFEKNYLLFRDQDSFQEFKVYMSRFQGDIDKIHAEIIKDSGKDNYEKLKNTIAEYDRLVDSIPENFESQRMHVSSLIDLGREIETSLRGKELETFLVLRRYEKNLIMYKDRTAYETFTKTFASMNPGISKKLKDYGERVDSLFQLYLNEQSTIEALRLKGREIEFFTVSLSRRERENIDRILTISLRLVVVALFAIILLGTFVNIRLASNIATPIRKLERVTKKVAAGDFSEAIEVKGKDEITSLEISFNQMEDRLKETLSSLELAVKNLHEKQEELIEAEKLASLGRIAAGVAHEINNPLAIINEKAGLLQDILLISGDLKHKEKFLNLIEGIVTSVNRCRAITHRLLGFVRRMEVTFEPMDINETVREVKEFLGTDISLKSIRFEMNLREDLPQVRSDKVQVEQILLNIIKNAIDAVEEGGFVQVATGTKEGTTVQISIRDNGPGIPKDQLKRIFEPFFTTKERGKGTGLGLFVSYGIMKKLGGTILVESETGKGTLFVVELPIQARA
jgi:two-component system NtrC family sensor kinase